MKSVFSSWAQPPLFCSSVALMFKVDLKRSPQRSLLPKSISQPNVSSGAVPKRQEAFSQFSLFSQHPFPMRLSLIKRLLHSATQIVILGLTLSHFLFPRSLSSTQKERRALKQDAPLTSFRHGRLITYLSAFFRFAYFLRNLSIRPAVSISFCFPV